MDYLDALRLDELLSLAQTSGNDDPFSSGNVRMLADVVDTPNSYVFTLDMPGLKRDQIKVHVEKDAVLVISGERKREEVKVPAPSKAETENDKKGSKKNKKKTGSIQYICSERIVGRYLRKFALPEDGDRDKISALYEDGVLTVTVEKRPLPQPAEPKTIEVKVA